MEITTETRERVFAAADALFERNGKTGFPTVDAVRKAARVKMGDASAGMREWRRLQTAPAAAALAQVPEGVQLALSNAAATVWRQALEVASEAVSVAHAEAEKDLQDALQQEMAEAFERQSAELTAAAAALAVEKEATKKLNQELASARQELRDASSRADKAEARNVEVERRAEELREERDRAMEAAAKARDDAAAVRGRLEAADMLGLIPDR